MLVRALGVDHAVLLSTHILPEALQVCDRVMILNRGRLVAMDRPDRLARDGGGRGLVVGRVRLNRQPDPGVPGTLVEKAKAGDHWWIEGEWDEQTANETLQRLIDQGAAIIEWRSGTATLEEVFRKLTLGEEEA